MRRNRLALIAVAALLAAFTLSACNTVRGFGQDVKKAGGELEEAAEDAKN